MNNHFIFGPYGRDFLLREYGERKRSTYDIAKEAKVSATLVRQALQKHGIPIRTKSEAQKAALASGRHGHPTKGFPRSNETKDKISKAMKEKNDE